LFDISGLSSFADNNFKIRWNQNFEELKEEMSSTLNMIIKSLQLSGLQVNQLKLKCDESKEIYVRIYKL
jgi:hypothetical protein